VPKFELYKHNDELFNIYYGIFYELWRWPSWLEVGITGHNFGWGPSKDHSTKVWLQLAQWFLRRKFVCEFPIGYYVKLSSAVGAILIEGPNRWKKSPPLKLQIQSQPKFVEMILGWSPFNMVSVSAVLYPRWPPLLKIEISSKGTT
jgi:hypothetical protein